MAAAGSAKKKKSAGSALFGTFGRWKIGRSSEGGARMNSFLLLCSFSFSFVGLFKDWHRTSVVRAQDEQGEMNQSRRR